MSMYTVTMTLFMDSDAPQSDDDLDHVENYIKDCMDTAAISAYDIDVQYKEEDDVSNSDDAG
jgi:hypothetical protein